LSGHRVYNNIAPHIYYLQYTQSIYQLHYHTDLHGDTSYTAVSLNKNESRPVKRDLDCVAITGSHMGPPYGLTQAD